MKKIIVVLGLILSVLPVFGQLTGGTMSSATYAKLKAEGKLPDMTNIEIVYPNFVIERKDIPQSTNTKANSSCYGYTAPTVSATSGLAGTDDSFLGPISLPFTFCFYGVPYTSFYLNSNGNITFGVSYTSFTASGFPSAFVPPMVAPFWGDVDYGGSGQSYYEIFADAAIIHWENAGYFPNATDKLNTFELIITDGTSPLLSTGNNVGFFYDNMDWTTGSASGGTNGFGGTAATVGVNKGDGTTYIQLGRFDQPGSLYDGAFGNPDGVDWLDNKTFMFNVCSSTNIPPIIAGIDICDTLNLCVGDTMDINFSVISGEAAQTSVVVLDSSLISNYTLISNLPGNTATVTSYLVGDTSNIGLNTLSVMAFDDGIPADTIWFEILVLVDSIPFHPVLTGDTVVCFGNTVTLSATTGFDSYLWSNGGVVDSIVVGAGSYSVAATIGGCTETTPVHVVSEYNRNIPLINGDSIICVTGDPLLDVVSLNAPNPSVYASYLWSPGGETTDTVVVGVGSYSVVTIDTSGCSENSVTVNVIDFATGVGITGATVYCQGDSVLLDAGPGFDSYLWNTGNIADTLQTVYVTQGTYSVTITDSVCSASISQTITEVAQVIPVISGDSLYCFGTGPVTLTATGGTFSSVEWLPGGQTILSISASQGSYQVVGNYNICSDTSSVFVVGERPISIADITFTDFICTGDSSIAQASNNFVSYAWSNGDSLSSTTFYQGGAYTLSVVDLFNCAYDTTINITDVNTPQLVGDPMACNGTFQFIQNTAPQGVLWTYSGPGVLNFTNSVNDINPMISTTTNGVYTVTMTDDKCLKALSYTIDFEGDPQASLSDQEICKKENYVFDAGQDLSVVSYSWSGGVNEATLVAEITGWYAVEITGFCSAITDSAYLDVVNCEIPNVITPNSDGQNDFFTTRTAEIHADVVLTIFNRWGRKVYEMNNYDNKWHGQGLGGKQLSSGTYFYVMTWSGNVEKASGTVTIFNPK